MKVHDMRTALASLGVVIAIMAAPPDARGQWQPDGVALCQASSTQGTAYIISDGAGGAIVTWVDSRNGGVDIYAQRVDASGFPLWTADGDTVCTAANVQDFPRIVSDGAGGAIVTWTDTRPGASGTYAQRVDASGVPQWTADGVFLGGPSATDPTTTADGAGGAIVTWQRFVASGNNDIWAQRVDASGVPQWPAGGVALCTATREQQDPVPVSDGAGGAIVAWYDSRTVGLNKIYAQRVDASGVPLWPADGVALCNQWSQFPRIVSDGAGGAIVTWQDARGAAWDVYAQRVDASGVPQWTVDGVALCTAASNQVQVASAPDGAGGAIVAWQDARSPFGGIYAQRVDASGVPQWTTNGVAATTAFGVEYPAIVSDGKEGAIVTWRDLRDPSDSDIYAQHLNAFGVPMWTTNGEPVCLVAGAQGRPQIASDGGAAIVAWDDQRGAVADIYAMKTLVPTGIDAPSAVGGPLLGARPNPFTTTATIVFELARPSHVRLSVHDAAGRLVRLLVNARREPGAAAVSWDGLDHSLKPVGAGVYFLRLESGRIGRTERVVLVR